MTTVEVKVRYRIAISTSVKGIKTFDCTVDAEGLTQEEVLKRSDDLVKELDARYPPGGAS
jgi:hypothetical protein